MRLVVAVSGGPAEGEAEWRVEVRSGGAAVAASRMLAVAAARTLPWPEADPPPPAGDPALVGWQARVAAVDALATAVAERRATTAQCEALGAHLFEALLGPGGRVPLDAASAAGHPFELALLWDPGQVDLHRFVWELLHDGTAFLALRKAAPAAIVRMVPVAYPAPVTIAHVPRVLFAVGARLADRSVRPGAEFMGILQGLAATGGAIRASTLEEASRTRLQAAATALHPDIVHVIGHGRWDAIGQRALVQLQPEQGQADDWITGPELGHLLEGGGLPTAVVLSACDTGQVGGAPVAGSVADAPFAVSLVASGVPVVVAMAGEVADTACRIFTRALTAAISSGASLGRAVTEGRRAAFSRLVAGQPHPGPTTVDWALPSLFLAENVPEGFTLVDAPHLKMIRELATKLDLVRPPIFYGRGEFFADLEQLLEPEGLSVLIAANDLGIPGVGGSRLLSELALTALRAGHLPCLIPALQPGDRPRSLRALLVRIEQQLRELRNQLKLPGGGSSAVLHRLVPGQPAGATLTELLAAERADRLAQEATGQPVPEPDRLLVAEDLRADVQALVTEAAAARPTLFGPHTQVLLLFDDVHGWGDGVDVLVEGGDRMLTPSGFGAGATKLPVVLYASVTLENGEPVKRFAQEKGKSGWCRAHPLARFDDGEDTLAYQWWLLNPQADPSLQERVFAARRLAGDDWYGFARSTMTGRPIYDCIPLYAFAKAAEGMQWFTSDDDTAILQGFGSP